MSKTSFNPRYVVYARAHGRTPEEMLEHDKQRFPGGKMCGFILWINDRWQAWHQEHGYRRHDYIITREDHAHFDEWIKANPAPATPEEILEQALQADDPKLIERWWNAGGDIVGCIRLMQKRAPACTRTYALMRASGLDQVHTVES